MAACTPTTVGTDADLANIRQLIGEQFKSAWDENDPERIASFFSENADLTFPVSDWIRGREAIHQAFVWDKPEGITAQFDIRDIRFLSGKLALVNIEAHFAGGKDPAGMPIPDYWDSATALMQKEGDGWKYVALRVMPARGDAGTVRNAIEGVWQNYMEAVRAGEVEKSLEIYAPDVLVFGEGLPEQGLEDIRAHYEEAFGMSEFEVTGNEILEFEVMGVHAMHRGIYRETQHWANGEVMDFTLNYYALWERQPDNSWKIKRLMFNNRV